MFTTDQVKQIVISTCEELRRPLDNAVISTQQQMLRDAAETLAENNPAWLQSLTDEMNATTPPGRCHDSAVDPG